MKLNRIYQCCILFLGLLLLLSYKPIDNCFCYKQALACIKNDKVLIQFLKTANQANKDNIIVGKEMIGFNLNSLDENIINKDYTKGYTLFPQKKLSAKEQQIEKFVSDSLSAQTIAINSKENHEDSLRCIELFKKGNKLNGIVFFSKMYENQIYAEVMQLSVADTRNSTFHYSSFGMGKTLTFLFVFKDGKLIKYYKGELYKN